MSSCPCLMQTIHKCCRWSSNIESYALIMCCRHTLSSHAVVIQGHWHTSCYRVVNLSCHLVIVSLCHHFIVSSCRCLIQMSIERDTEVVSWLRWIMLFQLPSVMLFVWLIRISFCRGELVLTNGFCNENTNSPIMRTSSGYIFLTSLHIKHTLSEWCQIT